MSQVSQAIKAPSRLANRAELEQAVSRWWMGRSNEAMYQFLKDRHSPVRKNWRTLELQVAVENYLARCDDLELWAIARESGGPMGLPVQGIWQTADAPEEGNGQAPLITVRETADGEIALALWLSGTEGLAIDGTEGKPERYQGIEPGPAGSRKLRALVSAWRNEFPAAVVDNATPGVDLGEEPPGGPDMPDPSEGEPAPPDEREIPTDQIRHFPGGNVREQFSDLEELAASIKKLGILQPLVVNEQDGGYVLIAGERRLRAAGLAGLTTVPCRVRHLSHEQALEAMLVENIQRQNLSPLEEARAYRRLLDLPGATQGSVAERVGKSRVHVLEHLQLLDLPAELQQQVAAGALGVKSALAYLRQTKDVPDPVRAKVAQALVTEQPTTREAPRIIDRVLRAEGVARATPPAPPSAAPPAPPSPPPAQKAAPLPLPFDVPPPAPTVPTAPTAPPESAMPQSPATPAGRPLAPSPLIPGQQPSAPQSEVRLASPPAATAADEDAALRSVGLNEWPAPPDNYEAVMDLEGYLGLPEILDHWRARLSLGVGLPRGFGRVEIHIPESFVWIRGPDTLAVKPPEQYQTRELPIILDEDGTKLRVQCAGGQVSGLYDGRAVYYRTAIYVGRNANHKLLRQQVVIRENNRLHNRHLVLTGRDSITLHQDRFPDLAAMLRGLTLRPVAGR